MCDILAIGEVGFPARTDLQGSRVGVSACALTTVVGVRAIEKMWIMVGGDLRGKVPLSYLTWASELLWRQSHGAYPIQPGKKHDKWARKRVTNFDLNSDWRDWEKPTSEH